MNKSFSLRRALRRFPLLLLAACSILCASCSDDDEAPRIDSVWYNMVARPVEQAPCAYPGQTLCLHGSGFSDLRRLIVNGTDINLNTILVYVADKYITFKLPDDINTEGDNIRVVTAHGMTDHHFVIRPKDEQPTLYYDSDTNAIPFSTTTLVPGNTLIIRGTNLQGVKEVWLPLAFDGRIACAFDESHDNTDEYIYVIVPEDAHFVSGRCEVLLERSDDVRGITWEEKVYSEITDFIN